MDKSNSKGMFERAKDRWLCAMICMAPHLKCRADRVNSIRNVADLMLMHTSRAMFFRDGDLVAFPSLHRLAFMAGLNEKTVRRAIDDLVDLGLIRIKHRFEDSNFFYLVVPAAAEEHSKACLDLLTNRRNRTGNKRNGDVTPVTRDGQNPQQLSQSTDSYEAQTPINVQGHSEDTLIDTLSLREPTCVGSINGNSGNEAKRLSDEVREARPQPSHNPSSQRYREARELFGDDGASIIGKAIREGVPDEDIRDVLNDMREYSGPVEEFAHALYLKGLTAEKPRDLAKEKRVYEGLQSLKAELSRSLAPDAVTIRRFGPRDRD